MSKIKARQNPTNIHGDVKNLTQIDNVQGNVNVQSRSTVVDMKDVASKFIDLLAGHIYIFFQILINPKIAFIDLLSPLPKEVGMAKMARSIVKPFLYATINLAASALLSSTLPIKNAPGMTISSFLMPVVLTQIFMLTI